MRAKDQDGQMASDKVKYLSGWRDLNSRPLDPQIGPPRLSSVNHLSLVSMIDR
jgi:hypothetical protein